MKTADGSPTASFLVWMALSVVLTIGCKNETTTNLPQDATPPTVRIESPTSYETCRGLDTVRVSASDDVGVTKVEVYLDGALAASATSQPWAFPWDTKGWNDGNHSLQAKAYDKAGNVGQSVLVTVSVRNQFILTFYNPVFTDITITAAGVTKTAAPDDSARFTFTSNPGQVTWTASTSGATTSGTRVGKLISWGETTSVLGYEAVGMNLVLNRKYFFLYIKNTSSYSISPLYVNYGLTDQTVDNISIPNTGAWYRIGYYLAYTNTIIRTVNPYYSYEWKQGTDFTFPWTDNQYVMLNAYRGATAAPILRPDGERAAGLDSSAGVPPMVRHPKAGTVRPGSRAVPPMNEP